MTNDEVRMTQYDGLIRNLSFVNRKSWLADIFIPGIAFEADDPALIELAHNADYLLLRSLHIPYLDGTQNIHVFLHHLHRTTGHIPEKLGSQLLAGAFQRNG